MVGDDGDADVRGSQEILIVFWSILMVVLVILFSGVMWIHHKAQQLLHKRLYNFNRAPKNYVDDDTFIELRDP